MKWFKANECPKCGEWSEVYCIGHGKYECGKCGHKWRF